MPPLTDAQLLSLVALVLAAVWLFLRWRGRAARPPQAVIDGSNVMHWRDNRPDIAPVIQTAALLGAMGYHVRVIFDANAGYRLSDRYMGDHALARRLSMRTADVFVVPKGEQADPFLLRFARDTGAIVISNDRFRDRIADFPALAAPGRLVRGGWRDGKVWLDLPARQRAA